MPSWLNESALAKSVNHTNEEGIVIGHGWEGEGILMVEGSGDLGPG